MKKSIRFKLTFIMVFMMLFTIAMALMISKCGIKWYFEYNLRKHLISTYSNINTLFASNEADKQEISTKLGTIAGQTNIDFLVFCKDGTVYTNTNEKGMMHDSLVTIISLLKDNENLRDEDGNKTNYLIQQNHDNLLNSDYYDLIGVLGTGDFVIVRGSVTSLNESTQIAVQLFSYVCVFATIIGSIAMFIIASKFSKPIHDMAIVAKRMSDLDFDAKIDVKTQDEIGELGKSMNVLSGTLEHTISELKTVNNELRKDVEQKNQIDEMRKEFLSHVSHELKTPIALIQGYAEGLKENISEDPESRDFYCEVIMDEANKMNNMVKKLLTLNEIEFGTERVEFQRFDIVELIKNMINASEILLSDVKCKVTFLGDKPIYVWADEFLIETVLTNYFTNAIHHVSENGEIRIDFVMKEKEVRVQVFNTGMQIPEEEIDKLWVKFYKVDKARTREYGGSGIGLSIVAATMAAHGKEYGCVNMENGVMFYFDLDTNINC